MATEVARPRVGLLGLTLGLYEDTSADLRPGRERWVREHVLPALEPTVEVLFEGAVWTRSDVERTVARYEQQNADALLVMLLTYSPSQIALPALKATRLPIVIWNTQELWQVGQAFDSRQMVENHGVHGTQDLANVLLRSQVEFDYVTSHLSDESATEELTDFFAAAAAVRHLRSARLGILGHPFPGMGDFALDTTHMAATLGCEWIALCMPDFIRRADAAGDEAVHELVEEYTDTYAVAADVTDCDLQATARAELALRAMAADERLDALTYQFTAFGQDERAPTIPFVAASRLMAEGVGFGGEGDLVAAAGTALLNRLQPPASFTEVFTVDFGGNGLLISHMGEANVAMARRDRRVALVKRRPIATTRHGQLVLAASFEPGPATLCALTQGPGSRWRLIAAHCVVADYFQEAMVVPHALLTVDGDIRSMLTAYATAGGPHHSALCFGDARRRIRKAAGLLGADYCEV